MSMFGHAVVRQRLRQVLCELVALKNAHHKGEIPSWLTLRCSLNQFVGQSRNLCLVCVKRQDVVKYKYQYSNFCLWRAM